MFLSVIHLEDELMRSLYDGSFSRESIEYFRESNNNRVSQSALYKWEQSDVIYEKKLGDDKKRAMSSPKFILSLNHLNEDGKRSYRIHLELKQSIRNRKYYGAFALHNFEKNDIISIAVNEKK